MAEWKIRTCTQMCFSCRKTFPPEERFFSALFFCPPEIERRDFCGECWNVMSRSETLAYWILQAPEEDLNPTEVGPLDMNRVKRMIKVDLQLPTAPPGLAGLLALMLARRRMAKVVSVEPKTIHIRFRDEDEAVKVPAPTLEGDALEKAQVALWSILDQMTGGSSKPPSS